MRATPRLRRVSYDRLRAFIPPLHRALLAAGVVPCHERSGRVADGPNVGPTSSRPWIGWRSSFDRRSPEASPSGDGSRNSRASVAIKSHPTLGTELDKAGDRERRRTPMSVIRRVAGVIRPPQVRSDHTAATDELRQGGDGRVGLDQAPAIQRRRLSSRAVAYDRSGFPRRRSMTTSRRSSLRQQGKNWKRELRWSARSYEKLGSFAMP